MKGLEFLESLPKWQQGAFCPIEIPREIFAALGNPQDKVKTIHVAGTNGKGTTCAAISELLISAGEKTGFFSSPHLIEVTERCRINNQSISKEKFDYYLSRVAEIVSWDSSAMTYFVATAVASFLCLAEEQVDYAVIEVGLGGKFDATNLISKPELAIITNIDFDHTDILGHSLAEIAENKAGIIKQNSKLLLGDLKPEAEKVILEIAKQQGAEVFYPEKNQIFAKTELIRSNIGQAAGQLALKALNILKLQTQPSVLEELTWPGRLQLFELGNDKKILIDGAHNAAGIRALFLHLEDLAVREKINKIALLVGLKQRAGWQETATEIKKAIENSKLEIELNLIQWEQGVENLVLFFDNPKTIGSFEKFLLKPEQLLVITGSLYLIGEAIELIRKK